MPRPGALGNRGYGQARCMEDVVSSKKFFQGRVELAPLG